MVIFIAIISTTTTTTIIIIPTIITIIIMAIILNSTIGEVLVVVNAINIIYFLSLRGDVFFTRSNTS